MSPCLCHTFLLAIVVVGVVCCLPDLVRLTTVFGVWKKNRSLVHHYRWTKVFFVSESWYNPVPSRTFCLHEIVEQLDNLICMWLRTIRYKRLSSYYKIRDSASYPAILRILLCL